MTAAVSIGEIALVLTEAKENRVYYNANDHYTSGYIDLQQAVGLGFIMITQNNGVRKQHLLGELKRYDIRPAKPKFVIDEIGEYLTSDGRKAFVKCLFKYDCMARLEGVTRDAPWNIDGTYETEIRDMAFRTRIVEKVKGYGPK